MRMAEQLVYVNPIRCGAFEQKLDQQKEIINTDSARVETI